MARPPFHDLDLVRRAVGLLEDAGFEIAVFGGWAEELRALRQRGAHRDVDLLVMDGDREQLDSFLAGQYGVPTKRLPHKRGFVLDGVLVELLLVTRVGRGAELLWWGEQAIAWPDLGISSIQGLPVTGEPVLTAYRNDWSRRPEGLWDHDFHPDEPDVRVFVVPPTGVLRRSDSLIVTEARHGSTSCAAFADHWLKINVTTDLDGRPAVYGDDGFTFNCDIATPMHRDGSSVYAVDLFLDVLVDRSGRDFEVVDRQEFHEAVQQGLISGREAAEAEAQLARLLALIRSGQLISWLDRRCPLAPSSAPPALPVARSPVTPVVAARTRPSW